MSTANKMNIYQRMNAIMAEVGVIEKVFKKEIKMATISHDQVSIRLNPLFVKHGVHPSQTTISCETIPHERETYKGTTKGYSTHTAVNLRFTNIDDPTEFIDSVFHGEAIGTDGKHVGASYSFAIKTGMLKTFCIPSGEDEELYSVAKDEPARNNKPGTKQVQRQPAPKAEDRELLKITKAGIGEYAQRNSIDKAELNDWLKGLFGGRSLNELNDDELVTAQFKVYNEYLIEL
jgi:hypothetical protein